MPNYDGTGPLKRGRVIGRGIGPCRQGKGSRPLTDTEPEDRIGQNRSYEPGQR